MRDRTFLAATIAAMLVGALLLVMLWSAIPARASHVQTRCSLMTQELNSRRSPDVRLKWLLCDIAHRRATQMAAAGRGFHDLDYIMRRLDRAGVCWSNVGEAVGWSTRKSVDWWFGLWWQSSTHRRVLAGTRYDRGGGSWHAAINGDMRRTYFVYIVLDTTNGTSKGCN